MTRRVFNFATIASLLLGCVVCILWVRSHRLTDKVVWNREDGQRSLRSAEGRVVLSLYVADRAYRASETRGVQYNRDVASSAQMELFGMDLLCSDRSTTTVHWARGDFAWSERRSSSDLILAVVVPFWSIAIAMAAFPLMWTTVRLRSRWRAGRKKPGFCDCCGYDLRASPRICPECGTERTSDYAPSRGIASAIHA